MLHAWDKPAWVDGRPFVDSFYTCNCPAVALAERGYRRVIALANEPTLYQDIFQDALVPGRWRGALIEIIAPEIEPAAAGVGYTEATAGGLATLFAHGRERGAAFLGRATGN
jgi:hypothetical protein